MKEVYQVEHWNFFRILLVGMGFVHWEVGFGKKKWAGKWDWYPPQDPH